MRKLNSEREGSSESKEQQESSENKDKRREGKEISPG